MRGIVAGDLLHQAPRATCNAGLLGSGKRADGGTSTVLRMLLTTPTSAYSNMAGHGTRISPAANICQSGLADGLDLLGLQVA